MITLEGGDVAVLVGEDRLEAVPVSVRERELRAGVGAFPTDDHPGAIWPADGRIELSNPGAVAWPVVGVDRRLPGALGDLEDPAAQRLVACEADRVPVQASPFWRWASGRWA